MRKLIIGDKISEGKAKEVFDIFNADSVAVKFKDILSYDGVLLEIEGIGEQKLKQTLLLNQHFIEAGFETIIIGEQDGYLITKSVKPLAVEFMATFDASRGSISTKFPTLKSTGKRYFLSPLVYTAFKDSVVVENGEYKIVSEPGALKGKDEGLYEQIYLDPNIVFEDDGGDDFFWLLVPNKEAVDLPNKEFLYMLDSSLVPIEKEDMYFLTSLTQDIAWLLRDAFGSGFVNCKVEYCQNGDEFYILEIPTSDEIVVTDDISKQVYRDIVDGYRKQISEETLVEQEFVLKEDIIARITDEDKEKILNGYKEMTCRLEAME